MTTAKTAKTRSGPTANSTDRVQIVHENFVRRVSAGDLPNALSSVGLAEAALTAQGLVQLFRAQVRSRHLDRHARMLQKRGAAFYTIGSSGHEGMAAVAMAARPDDMAFLHYRDAAFQIARADQLARQSKDQAILWDMLLSFTASSEDPISGGRHKVLGSKALNIPPQTSTIASHLPKAVGAAFSIPLAKKQKPEHQQLADDSVILCSFGDASLNHSTAQGALNFASWMSYQNTPLPLVFICEDNGIGISVKTPQDWVRASVEQRPGLTYMSGTALDPIDGYHAAKAAISHARTQKAPVFLHLQTVRLYGHAGADVSTAYTPLKDVEADEANDPLLHTARRLISEEIMDRHDVLAIYNEADVNIAHAAEHAITRPKLISSADVAASIIPPKRACEALKAPTKSARAQCFDAADMRALAQPQHMAKHINAALTDIMLTYPDVVTFGEDIGRKGGVYGVTQKLQARFGRARVMDSLLDEQSILGMAIGMAHNGFVPIPEIQFLAYLHNAEDQLRGEAATLPFFSNGQYTNPMVIRIAGLGYQRGFGGHFHNDNSIAVLRDIPGVVLACPSTPADAAMMLREAVRLAHQEQRVVVFLEPIALYMTRDLHGEGDGGWLENYPPLEETIAFGEIGIHGANGAIKPTSRQGTDLAILTYGNGHYLSRQAQKILKEVHAINARVIDIRWLSPLPETAILKAIKPCATVLIVDECRKSGSLSEALMALISEQSDTSAARLTADDCFIATGPAYAATLPSRDGIVAAALELVAGG